MAGFRKAKPLQAFIKMAMFGKAGSGKTFTALLCAEGLANATGKRIAYVDTERGTDFYARHVADRQVHPDAFDFDAIYTKSCTEVLQAIRSLDPSEHGVVVLDSMTHLWESAQNAYRGKRNSNGSIPLYAWTSIKKPLKSIVDELMALPVHVFLLGREGSEFGEDESSGEQKEVGKKMRTMGEVPYEGAVTIWMHAQKQGAGKVAIPTAFAEKDRTGVLSGRSIEWPNFERLCVPILAALGEEHAPLPSAEAAAAQDIEALSEEDRIRVERSRDIREEFSARLRLAKTKADADAIGKEITKEIKAQLEATDLKALKDAWLAACARAENAEAAEPAAEDFDGFEPDGDGSSVADGEPVGEMEP